MGAAPDDALFRLLAPSRLTAVADVGANPIDGVPPYKPLLAKRLCRVVGFEPQAQALAALNAAKSEYETYLPAAVGDGQEGTLRICKAPGMTSLFKPDPRVLAQFDGFAAWGQVVGEERIATRRLDDIAEIESLDFLKIDVQGSELAVFRGGRERLSRAVAIQTEVSFIALYEGQPTFGDIDVELRQMGFVPHAFAGVKKWAIAPVSMPKNQNSSTLNQLLEADIVYVRDFSRDDAMNAEQLKHLALIAFHCYRSFDLAANCVRRLVALGAVPADALARYVALIGKS
ncbi:MAG TPA: FkbM family methyltransferase [Pseudolabrys sp.]|jgi:FkbM family methyltransferase|nr:FkbM family methyltransferase [Pseudolabrys sp.]